MKGIIDRVLVRHKAWILLTAQAHLADLGALDLAEAGTTG